MGSIACNAAPHPCVVAPVLDLSHVVLAAALTQQPGDWTVGIVDPADSPHVSAVRNAGFAMIPINLIVPETCATEIDSASCKSEVWRRWGERGHQSRFLLVAAVGDDPRVLVFDALGGDVRSVREELVRPYLECIVGPELHCSPEEWGAPQPQSPPPPPIEEPARFDYERVPAEFETPHADLRADFTTFCRHGRKRRRVDRWDPPDLRPSCRRGPVFGYFRASTWVTLGLLAGTLAATGVAFGLHAAGRRSAHGVPLPVWGGVGAGFSVGLSFALIGRIIHDRRRARAFIREEKMLRSVY